MREFFQLVDQNKHPVKIGFDSCMVSGILQYMTNVNLTSLEPCDAGRFSAYISEDLKMYPCSFMMEYYKGEDLRKTPFIDIWNNSNSFQETRKSLNSSLCNNCDQQKNCLNGCPFLREIELCQNIEK